MFVPDSGQSSSTAAANVPQGLQDALAGFACQADRGPIRNRGASFRSGNPRDDEMPRNPVHRYKITQITYKIPQRLGIAFLGNGKGNRIQTMRSWLQVQPVTNAWGRYLIQHVGRTVHPESVCRRLVVKPSCRRRRVRSPGCRHGTAIEGCCDTGVLR